jgi:hypothetical protein
MPTANIEQLLAYEDAIEPAWIQLISQAQINAYVEFSDAVKHTPYVDVQLADVIPTTHRHPFVNGDMVVDAWKGVLKCTVTTQRKKNSDKQTFILGTLRMIAMKYRREFPRALVPWHAVQLIKESGLSRGVDRENDLDWSELAFELHFSVRPDAWPAALPLP